MTDRDVTEEHHPRPPAQRWGRVRQTTKQETMAEWHIRLAEEERQRIVNPDKRITDLLESRGLEWKEVSRSKRKDA